jgi:hypothetical protein
MFGLEDFLRITSDVVEMIFRQSEKVQEILVNL